MATRTDRGEGANARVNRRAAPPGYATAAVPWSSSNDTAKPLRPLDWANSSWKFIDPRSGFLDDPAG
jgi:hypothetical protein